MTAAGPPNPRRIVDEANAGVTGQAQLPSRPPCSRDQFEVALRDDAGFRDIMAKFDIDCAASGSPSASTAIASTAPAPPIGVDQLELIGVFRSDSFFAHDLLEHRVDAVCRRRPRGDGGDDDVFEFRPELQIAEVSAAEVLGLPASAEDPVIYVPEAELESRQWQEQTLRAARDRYDG